MLCPKGNDVLLCPKDKDVKLCPKGKNVILCPQGKYVMSCPKGKDVIYITICHKGKDVLQILRARMSYYTPMARMSNEALKTRNELTSKSNMLTVLTPRGDQALYQLRGRSVHKLTVCMSVDSALATKTKTSASKQNLSIHRSRSGDTSTPGLKHQHHVL